MTVTSDTNRWHGAGQGGVVLAVVGGMGGVAVTVQLGGPGQTAPGVMELTATVVPDLLTHLAARHDVGLVLVGAVDAEWHEGPTQQEGQAGGAVGLH